MATVRTPTRADWIRALPTYQEAAELIEIHPSGITRAVAKLGIQPELWEAPRSTCGRSMF